MQENYYFTFRSVTAAQRGSKALHLVGISNQLLRTPKPLQQQGCGYCLRIGRRSFTAALETLRFERIKYNKIYCQPEDGRWEELRRDIL